MSPCHPFRPVPGQCGPNRRGPLPAPPFDPRDYWATRKCVSKLYASLGTKLDKADVVDPGEATEAGKAADAKSTYEELGRILAKLAKKADKATTLAGYGITDAATKAELAAKADLVDGKVPAAQLPSYVDDVLEYDTMSAFPATGESGKIYVAKDTNLTYRWSGTQYVEISPLPVLDDEVTEASANGVKSSGIWSWVKSLLPHWLTSDYAEPATVESVADKRDKSDLAVYSVTRTENTDWTWESKNKDLEAALNDAGTKVEYDGRSWFATGTPEGWLMYDPDTSHGPESKSVTITFWPKGVPEKPPFIPAIATRPRYMDETLGPAKQNQQIAAVATGDAQTPADGDLVKYDAADGRFVKATADKDYVKAENFSAESVSPLYAKWKDRFFAIGQDGWDFFTVDALTGKISSGYELGFHWIENSSSGEPDLQDTLDAKADRADTLAGYGITDAAKLSDIIDPALAAAVGKIADAKLTRDFVNLMVSTNSAHYLTARAGTAGAYTYPPFTSAAALRAALAAHTDQNPQFFYAGEAFTPTKNDWVIVSADEDHPLGTITPASRYGFVGTFGSGGSFQYQVSYKLPLTAAQIAALDSGVTSTRLSGLESDGKPTDAFATDLLGKQVANAKVRYSLATESSATMADRTVNIYTLSSGTVAMVFPTATTHDGKTYARDFLLKLTYSGGTLQMPQGVTKVGDELSFEAGKTYLIAFTEIESDKFYVRSIDITEAQA